MFNFLQTLSIFRRCQFLSIKWSKSVEKNRLLTKIRVLHKNRKEIIPRLLPRQNSLNKIDDHFNPPIQRRFLIRHPFHTALFHLTGNGLEWTGEIDLCCLVLSVDSGRKKVIPHMDGTLSQSHVIRLHNCPFPRGTMS